MSVKVGFEFTTKEGQTAINAMAACIVSFAWYSVVQGPKEPTQAQKKQMVFLVESFLLVDDEELRQKLLDGLRYAIMNMNYGDEK